MKFDFTARMSGPGFKSDFLKGDFYTINLPVQFRSASNVIGDNKLMETVARTLKNVHNIDIRPQDIPLYFACTQHKN